MHYLTIITFHGGNYRISMNSGAYGSNVTDIYGFLFDYLTCLDLKGKIT